MQKMDLKMKNKTAFTRNSLKLAEVIICELMCLEKVIFSSFSTWSSLLDEKICFDIDAFK